MARGLTLALLLALAVPAAAKEFHGDPGWTIWLWNGWAQVPDGDLPALVAAHERRTGERLSATLAFAPAGRAPGEPPYALVRVEPLPTTASPEELRQVIGGTLDDRGRRLVAQGQAPGGERTSHTLFVGSAAIVHFHQVWVERSGDKPLGVDTFAFDSATARSAGGVPGLRFGRLVRTLGVLLGVCLGAAVLLRRRKQRIE